MARVPTRRVLLRHLRALWWGRLVLVAGLALLAGALALHLERRQLQGRLDQDLLLSHRALQSEIDRFRYLPRVAAEDARIRAALDDPQSPGAIAAANRYLAAVTQHAGAEQLYLLGETGRTLAASNWQQPDSYVGHNYGFRPYFTDALRRGSGAVYAIGVTTGLPGYFISVRIDTPERPGAGVLVVKIDLQPLEQAWAEAGQQVAVTDADGVVFLTGEDSWRYRPLRPLTGEAQARLAASQIYVGSGLGSAPALLSRGGRLRLGDGATAMALRSGTSEGRWQLLAATPLWPARGLAGLAAGLTALTGTLGLALLSIRQHRRRLIALRLRQTEVMERKVTLRTTELAREVEARTRVEADLRATQQTLVHSEKMAALGRMSAAIVHEVSQPLAAMEATLTAAEFSLSNSPEKTAARLQSARGLIRRMQRMTKHLKNFSRRETAPSQPVAVLPVARSALQLVQPRADAVGVQPRLDAPFPDATGGDGPCVQAGPVRLEQVLVNLLHNAIEAVAPGTGDVTLRLREEGDQLRISVRDNGPGIAPDVLSRITEPFFSTKTHREGLGLGLSISHEVIQQFGGRLVIGAAPEGGAEISVLLPLLPPQTGQQTDPKTGQHTAPQADPQSGPEDAQ